MHSTGCSLETFLLDQRFIKRLTVTLLTISIFSIIGHVLFVDVVPNLSWTISHQIDLDSEAAWSSWYNTLVDTLAGAAAFLVAWVIYSRSQGKMRSHFITWIIIGCVFTYIGFDDNSQIHETMAGALQTLVERANVTQPFIFKYRAYLWIPALGVPGMVIVLYMIWFFRKNRILQNKQVRVFLLAGACLYLTYAGTEAIKNLAVRHTGMRTYNEVTMRDSYPREWALFQVFVILQESSELIGATLWMAGFLYYGKGVLQQFSMAQRPVVRPQLSPQTGEFDKLTEIAT